MTRSIHLIINPHAGRGRARKLLPSVMAGLRAGLTDIDLQVQQTSSPTDAKARVKAVAERLLSNLDVANPPALIMMGGDGMVSLGLNAVAGTPVRLGVIPAGTGNDFSRGMGLPLTPEGAVAGIVADLEHCVDLMRLDGDQIIGGAPTRWVGSVLSTGYDAMVNLRTNRRTVNIGALSYGMDALIELARFEPMNYRLTLDGVRRDELAMFICIGNAGYIGGGMHILPDASPTDGMLDVTIVHPVPRTTLLRLLPRTYNGAFAKDPAVEQLRVRSAVVDGDRMYGMADGEEVGGVPLTCSVVPNACWLMGVKPEPVEAARDEKRHDG